MQNYKKKNYTYTYKDFYREYRIRQRKSGVRPRDIIVYKKYRAIVEQFFILLCRKIVLESFIFVMPYGLGNLMLKAYKWKPENLPINWSETMRRGKLTRFLCLHSFGYVYSVSWVKMHARLKNKSLYKFNLAQTSEGRSLIAKHVKETSKDPNRRSVVRF